MELRCYQKKLKEGDIKDGEERDSKSRMETFWLHHDRGTMIMSFENLDKTI